MSSLRRLAKDHAILRASLPPNYLFPLEDESDSLPDDLTQLFIYITGSEGTPYLNGAWLLHLRIPTDYPKSPPKATFKTRIFHPNVDELTGAVCLETLKRDWDPKLTLKDILVTISCLLIQPNPDSALNEKAGVLVREDYDGFVRQAKLMTRIHAPVPLKLKGAVEEARMRGEENGMRYTAAPGPHSAPARIASGLPMVRGQLESAKENDPAYVDGTKQPEFTPARKNVLGKRSLAELTPSIEADDPSSNAPVLSPGQAVSTSEMGGRPRKSPKHTHHSQANGQGAASDFHVTVEIKGSVLETHERSNSVSSTDSSRSYLQKKTLPPGRYRAYARVGIKRL